MKLALDFLLRLGDEVIDSKTVLEKADTFKERIKGEALLEGAVVVRLDSKAYCQETFDPILRLGGQWVRKLPWILTGDTETVAYRNSEHCFAFVPAGDSVEMSFFVGSENEVEEYLLEPANVRIDTFATESLKLVERLLEMVRKVSPSLDGNDDARELKDSLEEGKKAWRDYQLHNRR